MIETLLAQYLDRSALLDDRAWPTFLDHAIYTGPGATDSDKSAGLLLVNMLWNHGAKNGTGRILPTDQFLEHAGGNQFGEGVSRDYADPARMITLADDLDFNGMVLHPGWAKIHRARQASTPLILKLSGSAQQGAVASKGRHESDLLFENLNHGVELVEKYNAAAIGYTYYLGSPSQAFVHRDYVRIQHLAEQTGRPLIVWSYGRGEVIDAMGRNSFVSILADVQAAIAIGAHVLKINVPTNLTEDQAAYAITNFKTVRDAVEWQKGKSPVEMMRELVRVAHDSGVGVGFSGGAKVDPYGVLTLLQQTAGIGADFSFNGRNTSQTVGDKTGLEATNPLTVVELVQQMNRIWSEYGRGEKPSIAEVEA